MATSTAVVKIEGLKELKELVERFEKVAAEIAEIGMTFAPKAVGKAASDLPSPRRLCDGENI